MIFPNICYGGKLPKLTLLYSNFNGADTTVWTFLNVPLGPEASDRLIVTVTSRDFFGTGDGITIGGVLMDTVVSGPNNFLNIQQKLYPTGSSANIQCFRDVVPVDGCGIAVYSITGLRSLTATDTGNDSGAPSPSTSIDILNKGVRIGAGSVRFGSGMNWTNMTADYNFNLGDDTRWSVASALNTATQTLSVGITGTGSPLSAVMCAASWR
jgi:hypothetical protein